MTNRVVISLAVLFALFALWLSVGNQDPRELEADRPVATRLPESASDVAARTPQASEATPEVPAPQDRPVADVDAIPDSCAEMSRMLALRPTLSVGFAEGRDDERGCAMALRFLSDQRVPALPGLAGFEVSDMGGLDTLDPRGLLFDETDNSEWSRPMEGLIYNEIGDLLDFPVVTLQAVCKSSTCGFLFAYSNSDHHGGNYNYYAQKLADSLGFTGFHAGHSSPRSGIGFTYIYLGAWETRRPDTGIE